MTPPLVLGLGSRHGDDQAGWLIVETLAARGYPLSRLRRLRHAAELLDHLVADETCVVCDACSGGDSKGFSCWTWPVDTLAGWCGHGTHDLSLPAILQLARTLNCCPPTVEIWGVTGECWNPGAPLRTEVASAARAVADVLLKKYIDA